MAQIKNSLMECIGNTPLVRLGGWMKKQGVEAELLAKVESFNPLG